MVRNLTLISFTNDCINCEASKCINCDLRFIFLATNFSKIIAELEAQQQTLLANLAGNKTLLQNVQQAFAVNLENVKKEVGKLESRLDALKSK